MARARERQVPDRSFEMRLERLFAETPVFADAEYFTLRLEERLSRGWNFRQVLIGGFGLLGGAIGAIQILHSGVSGWIISLGNESRILTSARLSRIITGRFLPVDFPINGEWFFLSAALAIVAAGFAVARVLREL